MKRLMTLIVLASSLIIAGMVAGPVNASAPKSVAMKFKLHVVGNVDANVTYWVAYGPIDGKFGIIQLKQSGHLQFSASKSFPYTSHGVFTYLAGHGTVHTKLGLEPGGPIVTIKTTGTISVAGQRSIDVQWRRPQG